MAVSAERHPAGLRFCVYRARACVRVARTALAGAAAGSELLKVKFSAVFDDFLNYFARSNLKNFNVACIVLKCHVEAVCFIVALDNDFGFDFFTGTARYFSEKNTYACVGVFIGNNGGDFKVYRVASSHPIDFEFIHKAGKKLKVIKPAADISERVRKRTIALPRIVQNEPIVSSRRNAYGLGFVQNGFGVFFRTAGVSRNAVFILAVQLVHPLPSAIAHSGMPAISDHCILVRCVRIRIHYHLIAVAVFGR